MVILVDTNVVLDIIQGRKPYCEAAADIFTLCAMKKVRRWKIQRLIFE